MLTLPHLHTINAVTTTALTTAPHGLTLTPAELDAPLLVCLPDGEALLLVDWTDPLTLPLHVPAAMVQAVRLALNLSRVDA